MKIRILFTLATFLAFTQLTNAQTSEAEVQVSSKVIVDDGYDHAELAVNPWGGSHGLFFGAKIQYKGSDHLWSNGNAVYAYGPGQYDYGAYSMGYIANGGPFAFYEGGRSTGTGNPITWNAVMAFSRGGNVGIGTTAPEAKFTVAGDIWGKTYLRVGGMPANTDGQFRILGQQGIGAVEAATNRTAYLYADQGYYGLSAYDYNARIAIPLTIGFYATNTFINPNGGSVGIGTIAPSRKLHVTGSGTDFGQWLENTGIGASETARFSFKTAPNGVDSRAGTIEWFEGGAFRGDIRMLRTGGVEIRNSSDQPIFNVLNNGSVGIGTSAPKDYKLAVNGSAVFTKVVVRVNTGNWPDYVFDPFYKLPSLQEVESFIKRHKHLPDVPSAKEVNENGLDLGDNHAVLLKKVEEQMLYIIDQQKQIEQLKAENQEFKKLAAEMEQIKSTLNKLVQTNRNKEESK